MSPVRARLNVPVDETPKQIQLSIFEATKRNEAELTGTNNAFHYWMPAEADIQDLPLQSVQDLSLQLDPGLYVFQVFVSWKLKGDAFYGFLVEVK
jgi:hypothetical protein